VRVVKGLLIDGPAAGSVVEAGDPPVRRRIIVKARDGFSENAYRYHLTSVDGSGASYAYSGRAAWLPEARSQMVGHLADERKPVADEAAPSAKLNGD
jgi:hypothetical protein